MPASLKSLIKNINRSDISSLKTTLMKIISVIHDPDSSVMELKDLIEIDPPLTAKVLRLANSALYGRNRNIHSVMNAIIYIGFETVKEIVLNHKVNELYMSGDTKRRFSRKSLWIHSVAVANFCKLTYRKEFRLRGEDIYTAAILHDIGIIVEDQFLKKDFFKIVEDAAREGKNIHDKEIEVLGYCHEDVGKALAEQWNLPDIFVKTLHCAERPFLACDSEGRFMADMLFIANYVCNQRQIGYCELNQLDSSIYLSCLDNLNIKEKAVELILEEVIYIIDKMEEEEWF